MLALLRLKLMVNSLLSEPSLRKRQEFAEFSSQAVRIKDSAIAMPVEQRQAQFDKDQ